MTTEQKEHAFMLDLLEQFVNAGQPHGETCNCETCNTYRAAKKFIDGRDGRKA